MFSDIPQNLSSGPIHLRFEKVVSPDGDPQLVPFYHFKIRNEEEVVTGHINFRVGTTQHITKYAGHIGYEVLPAFRGSSYSLLACQALAPFIRKHYDEIIITAEFDHTASIKIIEKLGAAYIDEVDVSEDDPSYLGGARRKKRYRWAP